MWNCHLRSFLPASSIAAECGSLLELLATIAHPRHLLSIRMWYRRHYQSYRQMQHDEWTSLQLAIDATRGSWFLRCCSKASRETNPQINICSTTLLPLKHQWKSRHTLASPVCFLTPRFARYFFRTHFAALRSFDSTIGRSQLKVSSPKAAKQSSRRPVLLPRLLSGTRPPNNLENSRGKQQQKETEKAKRSSYSSHSPQTLVKPAADALLLGSESVSTEAKRVENDEL